MLTDMCNVFVTTPEKTQSNQVGSFYCKGSMKRNMCVQDSTHMTCYPNLLSLSNIGMMSSLF